MTANVTLLPSCTLEAGQGGPSLTLVFAQGSSGKSAYAAAVDGGFTGTEADFNDRMASAEAFDAILDILLNL